MSRQLTSGVLGRKKGKFPTDGMISYWKLNEDPAIHDTVILDSFSNNDGTLITNDGSENKSTEGIHNKGILFDGINDRIELGTPVLFGETNSFSISIWIKPNSISTNLGIFNFSGGRYDFWAEQLSQAIRFGLRNKDGNRTIVSAADSINQSGIWYNLIFTWGDGVIKIHINSSFFNSGARDGIIDYSSDYKVIGQLNTFSLQPYNGVLDEIMIYNRELSESEILQIYNM